MPHGDHSRVSYFPSSRAFSANGWDYLANAIRANGLGQILGGGKLTSQSAGQMPYLLTPVAVPEPTSLLLLAVAVLLTIPRSRVAAKNRC